MVDDLGRSPEAEQYDERFWGKLRAGKEVSLGSGVALASFFELYMGRLRESFGGFDDDISGIDEFLYQFRELGPRASTDFKITKIRQTKWSRGSHDGEKIVQFLATVSVDARYKSCGADRVFEIPIKLALHRFGSEESWSELSIAPEDFDEARRENKRTQNEWNRASRETSGALRAAGLRRPFRGGGTGLKG